MAISQDTGISGFIEDLVEEIIASSDVETDYQSLAEHYFHLAEYPVNLNKAKAPELEKLHILTDFQIYSLLTYIQKYGELASIYELQMVHGFSIEVIMKILPFITIKSVEEQKPFSLKNSLNYGRHLFFFRTQRVLETQKGYLPAIDSLTETSPNSRYAGSPYKIYTRYSYSYRDNLFLGFTCEKDAGEKMPQELPIQIFDFQSAHLQINNMGIIKTLVIGDFQAGFGQGLAFWSGFNFGKSAYVLNTRKNATGLRRYSSTDENRFMRGVGTTLNYRDFELSIFASRKQIDGNVSVRDTLTGKVLEFSSFQQTGMHRTAAEIENRKNITESIYGINTRYVKPYFTIGATFCGYLFDAVLNRNTRPYNQFAFEGSENHNASIDYQYRYKHIIIFGESAMSMNGAKAFIHGTTLHPHDRVSLSLLHRNYDRNYQALYGNGFSEGTDVSNENGIYLGTRIQPHKQWVISAYADSWSFPWLRYRVDSPSNGHDYFLQAEYNLSEKFSMYVRYRKKTKSLNMPGENQGINKPGEVITSRIRYHVNYQFSKSLSLRNRLEFSGYQLTGPEKENGTLVYQDVVYQFVHIPLSIALRYALHDTDSYNARIYAYENDVLYAFSIPAYYEKGTRSYAMLKYSISENFDFWCKYGITKYANLNSVGTGLEESEGNTRSEIKVQMRMKF